MVSFYSLEKSIDLDLCCCDVNFLFFFSGLDRKEKLLELGSRNFFLCPRKAATTVEGSVTTSFASCAKEAKKERQGCGGGGGGFAWFKLMQFMM